MTRKYFCHSRWLRLTQPNDSAIEMLEQHLRNVAQWCCANNLLINPSKTKLLFIGTRQLIRRISEVPQVSFLGWILQPATLAKDLGVILDPHLTYDYHIPHIVSSCFSKLYQINRVKKSFTTETLKWLIASLVFILFHRVVNHISWKYQ